MVENCSKPWASWCWPAVVCGLKWLGRKFWWQMFPKRVKAACACGSCWSRMGTAAVPALVLCCPVLAITMFVFEPSVLAQLFSIISVGAFGVGLFEIGNSYHAETSLCVIMRGFPIILEQCLFPVADRAVNRFLIRNFLKFIRDK